MHVVAGATPRSGPNGRSKSRLSHTPSTLACVCWVIILKAPGSNPLRDVTAVMDLIFISVRALARKCANDDSLSMHNQTQTDFPLYTFVLSMNLIPTLPQRERMHVSTPRRHIRSSRLTPEDDKQA